MGLKSINDNDGIYFLTSTIVDWVDIFTRPVYKDLIVESLKYCQKEKGLLIYGWVLMTNHLHWICSAREGYVLSDIVRDFKKFTSKKIISKIKEEKESRRKWLLDRFEFAGRFNKKIKYYHVWQDGNEPNLLYSDSFFMQKLDYIHQNPVKAGIVYEDHHYIYGSAINYSGGRGLIDIITDW